MSRPFLLDKAEREVCETCAHPCALGCNRGCPPGDRLPWMRGDGIPRVVHAACALKLSHSLNLERAATLIARRGPAFKVSA